MLKSLDILIGVSLVMLVASLAVTAVTQAMLALLDTRGRHLLTGVVDLLGQIDPALNRKHAREIGRMILGSPMINGGRILGLKRYGDVVHREELTKIVLELAARAESPADSMDERQMSALKALREAIAANGITNPREVLDNVRLHALALEQARPDLANDVRQSTSLLQHASSQFLAKINFRFDPIIDRVSDRFTVSARIWTGVSAALVAIALQLDTVTLVNRLAMDQPMRTAYVQEAVRSQDGAGTAPKDDAFYLKFLAEQGIVTPPTTLHEWLGRWNRVNYPGVIVSILLLSLGAPFWYSTLGRLLQLRSILAQKDDAQRIIRQTTQTAAATPQAAITAVPTVGGERESANRAGVARGDVTS